jgi:hypothetical protein
MTLEETRAELEAIYLRCAGTMDGVAGYHEAVRPLIQKLVEAWERHATMLATKLAAAEALLTRRPHLYFGCVVPDCVDSAECARRGGACAK